MTTIVGIYSKLIRTIKIVVYNRATVQWASIASF